VTVVADSAAASAGIEVLDIVVRYGGQPVANFDELRQLIGKNKVGDSVLIQVVRGGAPVTGIVEQRGSLELGLEVEAMSFGCKVKKLSTNGAAAKAGLRVGDVIAELNGEPVANMDELAQVFTPLGADARLEFGALRNTRLVSRRVTFGEWTESTQ
jgi:S1-C subfamily serine protease